MAPSDLNQGLHARAEQQLALQPRMLQSIEVLQLSATDLEAWLQEAAEENEALCVESPGEGPGPRPSREATDRHDEMLRNHPDRECSRAEGLEAQLALQGLDPHLEAWVRFLIASLDPHGYLSASDEELLDLAASSFGLEPDPTSLGLAIAHLQRLEPRGVGGRDLVEALLLQLDPADEEYALLCRLLEEFLEEIASNRLPQVARELGLELPELAELLTLLRRLDPRPAAETNAADSPVPLRPDVVVERDDLGSWSVRVERSALPSVSLDPELVELARDRSNTPEVKGWARDRVERARWIVDAVGQRGQTLLRVAIAVFERQHAFLDEGPGHLRPLRMGEVADELELHLSTVSRAVAGKHVQTPAGIFPLRYFFQVATGSETGPARDDLREMVRGIFAGEDTTAPLSDDEVSEQLARRGLEVARRTVAKYRKELGIPTSYRRKKHV